MRRHALLIVLAGSLAGAALAAPQEKQPAPTSEKKPAPASEKPAITPVYRGTGKVATKPQTFNPVPLPDSMSADVHAAWALRRRIGAAYWPAWASHTPAPLVVRGSPFDFFILHPDPPEYTTSPRVMDGGGYYHTATERLALPRERDPRIEEWNRWWCIAYDVEGGRRGPRADIITMLATRDFMVYETAVTKPVWGSLGSVETIMQLRRDPDLVAWLDQEAKAIRSAVLADDAKQRNEFVDNAVRARHMAEERTQKSPELKKALDWYEAATKSEGAARYIEILAGPEARAVSLGDTAYALPRQDSDYPFRAKVWRARAGAIKERDLTGATLGSLRDVGAMYCVLLDATKSSWQAGYFDASVRLVDQLDRARRSTSNSQAFGG